MDDEFKVDVKIRRGVYRHFKGDLYIIKGIAIHSETKEVLVSYRACKDGTRWVRPLKNFTENVVDPKNGRVVPRFELVHEWP
jgi:hypothetical protein